MSEDWKPALFLSDVAQEEFPVLEVAAQGYGWTLTCTLCLELMSELE